MKKMFIFITLLILSMSYVNKSFADPWDFNTEPYYCSPDYLGPLSSEQLELCSFYDNPVESLADSSEYTRIEKIDGIWYGVIDITDVDVISKYISRKNYSNRIGITFSRDTESLEQIELDYITVQDSCTFMMPLINYCLGSKNNSYEDTIIISNTSNSNSYISFLQGDHIREDDDYDYVLFILGPEVDSVTVVKFTYILTALEIIDLRLDIQEQYENEKQTIINNPLLSDDERIVLGLALMEEYLEYEIDYGDEMTSICIGDQCTAINSDTTGDLPGITDVPGWVENMISSVLKGVGYIGGAIAGISIVGIIAYMFVKKGVETSGNVALTGTKLTIRSSMWYGSKIGIGVLAIFSIIGNGIKGLPWWGKLILGTITITCLTLLVY